MCCSSYLPLISWLPSFFSVPAYTASPQPPAPKQHRGPTRQPLWSARHRNTERFKKKRLLIGHSINVQTLADLPFPHEAKKYCFLIKEYTMDYKHSNINGLNHAAVNHINHCITLHQKFIFKTVPCVFRFFDGTQPPCVSSRLSVYTSSRTLRSSSDGKNFPGKMET